MKRRCVILILLAIFGTAQTAAATDRVRKKDKETVFGQIAEMSNRQVVVVDRGSRIAIPVGQIRAVYYDAEPEALSHARADLVQGRNEDAQKALAGIDMSRIKRKAIADEIEFLKAAAAARLALAGKGEIREAGGLMAAFVANHRDSYRWFEANGLVADLLVANRQYAQAARYYDALGEAPWFEYRLRAALGKGRALLAGGKIDEAMPAFQNAIDAKPDSPKEKNNQTEEYRKLAQIGKARCTAAKGQPDEAARAIREILDETNPEDVTLSAAAYNGLGTALRAAGKPEDALLAFLHVDILYFASRDDHAEALANLAELWNELHQTDRAIKAQEMLKNRYPNSRWTPP
ncbi:MAG: tetratricopeptide repeat protein [Pirellulales bacterium]|nr:tetratricopeptide repeat protein [Pirellulales bacterium]